MLVSISQHNVAAVLRHFKAMPALENATGKARMAPPGRTRTLTAEASRTFLQGSATDLSRPVPVYQAFRIAAIQNRIRRSSTGVLRCTTPR